MIRIIRLSSLRLPPEPAACSRAGSLPKWLPSQCQAGAQVFVYTHARTRRHTQAGKAVSMAEQGLNGEAGRGGGGVGGGRQTPVNADIPTGVSQQALLHGATAENKTGANDP